eukprot:3577662-Pyramimonas_sp.AAC.1
MSAAAEICELRCLKGRLHCEQLANARAKMATEGNEGGRGDEDGAGGNVATGVAAVDGDNGADRGGALDICMTLRGPLPIWLCL